MSCSVVGMSKRNNLVLALANRWCNRDVALPNTHHHSARPAFSLFPVKQSAKGLRACVWFANSLVRRAFPSRCYLLVLISTKTDHQCHLRGNRFEPSTLKQHGTLISKASRKTVNSKIRQEQANNELPVQSSNQRTRFVYNVAEFI